MLTCWSVLAGIGLLAFVACARRPPVPAAAPRAPTLTPSSGLQVLLTWDAPVDLDLYLTDPSSETVYFANTPTRSGARLVRDARCADLAAANAPFVEVADMPEPIPGRYRVGVDFIETCGAVAKDQTVSFRVVVGLGDARQEATSTIRLDRFQPIVVEFELHRSQADGSLALEAAAASQED